MGIQLIKTKQFKALYPSYEVWKKEVWEETVSSYLPNVPSFVDETKMVYNSKLIYKIFYNKYSDFFCVNSDTKTHHLFINALMNTLPSLYAKTQMLTTEALDVISPETLFKNIEKRFNEDADNKYASTETGYSSTPDSTQKLGSFNIGNVKEKNVINRKDATVKLKEVSNYISKITDLANIQVSGFIDAFINSIEFSSLFEYVENPNVIQVIEGGGLDPKDKKQLDKNTEKLAKISDFKQYRGKFKNLSDAIKNLKDVKDGDFIVVGEGEPYLQYKYHATTNSWKHENIFLPVNAAQLQIIEDNHFKANTNEHVKLNKQLEYNEDFNADGSDGKAALYQITEDDDFISINWNGGSISGNIIGNATSKTSELIILGTYIDPNDNISNAKVTLKPNGSEFDFDVKKIDSGGGSATKILEQGKDFNTYDELRDLLKIGDYVIIYMSSFNIKYANGIISQMSGYGLTVDGGFESSEYYVTGRFTINSSLKFTLLDVINMILDVKGRDDILCGIIYDTNNNLRTDIWAQQNGHDKIVWRVDDIDGRVWMHIDGKRIKAIEEF